MTFADKIAADRNTSPEKKIADLLALARAWEIIQEGRQKWAWRLGPLTHVDLIVYGDVGEREVDCMLRYVMSLRDALRGHPPPAQPQSPEQP